MVRLHSGKRLVSLLSVLGLVAGMMVMALTAAPASAQDDGGHPAHIHSGSCDTLGEVAYPLSNVGPGVIKNGKAQPAGDTVGATEDIYPVIESVTTIKASLADIADGKHALNIHESKEQIQVYIACGNIGGTVVNGDLVIGLEERTNSGYSGIAVLHPREDTVVVYVYLSEGLSGGGEDNADNGGNAAPTSVPTAATTDDNNATPAEEAIDIQGFAFNPPQLEISAGTTVTWTNNDSATHTVTADDGSFDSGNLDTGATFSQTFDTPGTYTYHCNIHPSMTATIVVN